MDVHSPSHTDGLPNRIYMCLAKKKPITGVYLAVDYP